jgi:helicase
VRVADLDLDPRIADILAKDGIEELYPPQAEAVAPALAGQNLVLAIPTASGKSLVAYLAVLKSVLKGGKALYIVPLRALAAEKHAELKAFEPLGVKVGVSVGDYDRPDPTLEKFDVIVATSEKADSLLRHRTHWLRRLTVVVADEVHLIHDAGRGPTLEVTLAKLRQVNPDAQLIALSATIANSEELANWLDADHVASEWRPVPLKEGVYWRRRIVFTDFTQKAVKDEGDDLGGLVADVVDEGGQALLFVNTRRSAEAVARNLGQVAGARLDARERKALKKLAEDMGRGQEEATSMGHRLARCLAAGTAFHHAGLANDQRALVEKAFRKGLLKAIAATPTLAAGINLPARRVVVRDVSRFDANYGYAPIPVLEIKQMCGRAGRPRYDPYGEAILVAKRPEDVEDLLERYLLAPTEAIESKLGAEPALRMHILASVATEHVRTETELFAFMGRTFYAHQSDVEDLRGRIERVLAFLEREEFLRPDGGLRATFFGRRTSDLYIDPLSAVRLRTALRRDRDDPFYLLWAVCSTPDMPKLYLRRGDYAWVEEKALEEEMVFPVEDYDFFQAEIKTACLLQDWIEERSQDAITKRFGIGPGDIHRLVDMGEWLAYSMQELGKIFAKPRVPALARLLARLRYGVKEELLELVSLRGVGRVRARALWTRGFRRLRELQKADPGVLARIPTIGSALAKRIKEQVGAAVAEGTAGQAALSEFSE